MAMTEEELRKDIENRETYLGGSEMAAVLGQNKYKSKIELYVEKAGLVERKKFTAEQHERMDIGNEIEDFIGTLYCAKTGHKIQKKNSAYIHPTYPFFKGHVDRLICNEDGILEIKNVGHFAAKDWAKPHDDFNQPHPDGVPKYYYWQVMFYMYLSGKKFANFAAFFEGNRLGIYHIPRDEEAIAYMEKNALKFWNDVQEKNPPLADGSESAKAVVDLAEDQGETVQSTPDIDQWLQRELELGSQISLLKSEKEIYRNRIKQHMGNAAVLSTYAAHVTWKADRDKIVLKPLKDIEEFLKSKLNDDDFQSITKLKKGSRKLIIKKSKDK